MEPPAGPGVQPPFAAPPIDGDRTRLWVGLGVGAAAIVLCFIGGIAGVIGLNVSYAASLNEQAKVAVADFLDALRAQEYGKAYRSQCDQLQKRQTETEFRDTAGASRIEGYTLGDVKQESDGTVVMPVDLDLAGGQTAAWQIALNQDDETGELEVCGLR